MNNQRKRALTFTLNDEMQHELEKSLKLSAPCTVKVATDTQNRLHGTYSPSARRVTLELGMRLFEGSRLLAVQREVIKTLLHEYRHAYQYDHWTPERIAKDERLPYHLREMEKDAETYAEQNAAFWLPLGMIRPKHVYSNMRRIAAAEKRVR